MDGFPAAARAALLDVLGPKGVVEAPADKERYVTEWRGFWRGDCALVARPADTDETARVVAICADHGVAVYPLGGNTGLVGGGVPHASGVVVSTDRMTRMRAVDADNFTLTCEAGAVLADVQDAAAAAGRFFPLSLAAEGTCRIGGNLSTNAGGINVLRYGNARDLVLGIEVVLADGRVWNGLSGLRKDNTGYDLKDLFVGAEGTLGVITAATLKLFPKPCDTVTAMVAMPSAKAALGLFNRVSAAHGEMLTACELISRFPLELVLRHMGGSRDPFSERHAYYVLMDLASSAEGTGVREALEATLAGCLDDGLIDDAVVATGGAQAEALWFLRENIPEAQTREGASIKHDVSLPVSEVPAFLARARDAVEAALPGVRVCAFGHLGDGNLHYNLSQPPGWGWSDYLARWDEMTRLVHDIVMQMGGSFSAEHGIGQLKRDDLRRYRSATEIRLMETVKAALDPGGLMNPGKVL